MKKTILLILVLTLGMTMEVAEADFTFGEPTNLGPMVNSSSNDNPFSVSSDGLELYFGSDRPGGSGGWDIWITKRSTTDDEWGSPENLGPIVNSPEMEYAADISPDGLKLYLISYRSGGLGKDDVWLSTRASRDEPWTDPVNVGPPVSSQYDESGVTVSDDGLELYFMSGSRPGRVGDWDMWVCKRLSVTDPWGEPENLSALNSTYKEGFIGLSPDALVIFFDSNRPGGIGDWDLWMSKRSSRQKPWRTPVNLGPTINSPNLDAMGALSPDGSMLYFNSTRNVLLGGEWGDIWQAPIIPIVDLNGDGIVDAEDLCIVVDNWGTDNQLCDVGPMPWGDGVVDVEDLIVVAEHLFEVYPSAETVDVSEAGNGGQVEVELGKLLVFTLESNPSTGYRWEILENNDSVLKQFGQTEFKSSDTGDPPMVGSGGWEIFRFKAVNAGQTTLELVYHRSWEDTEPLNTFSIQVTVN